jgi:hypothetical protein
VRCGALVSDCGRYRYSLTRRWAPGTSAADGNALVFVMLNPSTADATKDDPTIRKCMGFARRLGRGGIVVVNLFAWRATDPADLWRASAAGHDVVGFANDAAIRGALRTSADVVLAWGAQPAARVRTRVREVLELVELEGKSALCLGVSADGSPRHPLMLPYAAPLATWEAP